MDIGLRLLEVVGIYSLDHICCCRGNAYVEVDHETGKLLTVNKDDFGVDTRRIVEPPRDLRRLISLRGLSHEQEVEPVFT
jgi:hypothetical protein